MFDDRWRGIAERRFGKCGIQYVILLFLSLPLMFACQLQSQSQPPDEVKLQLKWLHQAQFAGFYVAQEKGYYKAENINVTFMEGGQDIDIARRVIAGEADFGVITPEFIFVERSQGESLTAIAVIYRRSAAVFVSMFGSGIVRPQDFMGKTVATKDPGGAQVDFEILFYAMMHKLGLDASKVKTIPYDPEYTGFYNGSVEVTPTYYTGGLIKMRQKGLKLNLIWPSDYGIHFYSDTLVTTGSMINNNPDLVERFLRASLKGWQDAIEDYQQAVSVTMKYARIKDAGFQTAMLEAMLPLINTGEDHIGWMKPSEWQGMYEILLEQGLLAMPVDVKEAYTMRFLESIYGSKIK